MKLHKLLFDMHVKENFAFFFNSEMNSKLYENSVSSIFLILNRIVYYLEPLFSLLAIDL